MHAGLSGMSSIARLRTDSLGRDVADSQTFNNVAAPLLYQRVITDDLYGLVDNGTAPDVPVPVPQAAHPGIRSKSELLKLIKRLGLEYPNPRRDLTYSQLLAGQMLPRPSAPDDGSTGVSASEVWASIWRDYEAGAGAVHGRTHDDHCHGVH